MRVLVTGHCGAVGRPVAEHLERCGHSIVGFDLAEGADVLDVAALTRTAVGCSAIVHLGALADDDAGSPERIMAVNVLGTWHALLAAEAIHAATVIHFSSVHALGIAEGERLPDYFPVDDSHRRGPTRPYGLSKRLAEDLCRGFTARTAIPSVSLRPVAVWGSERYAEIEKWRAKDAESEWEPYWEYGAFVDVRDVADAVSKALEIPLTGHHRALLCAADISASAPSLELAGRLAPNVAIRDPERYGSDPWRALLDCAVAEQLLGWQPRYTWAGRR
jgi:UDP-glucose 4-epimerase